MTPDESHEEGGIRTPRLGAPRSGFASRGRHVYYARTPRNRMRQEHLRSRRRGRYPPAGGHRVQRLLRTGPRGQSSGSPSPNQLGRPPPTGWGRAPGIPTVVHRSTGWVDPRREWYDASPVAGALSAAGGAQRTTVERARCRGADAARHRAATTELPCRVDLLLSRSCGCICNQVFGRF